jgi:hypothetical protein
MMEEGGCGDIQYILSPERLLFKDGKGLLGLIQGERGDGQVWERLQL